MKSACSACPTLSQDNYFILCNYCLARVHAPHYKDEDDPQRGYESWARDFIYLTDDWTIKKRRLLHDILYPKKRKPNKPRACQSFL